MYDHACGRHDVICHISIKHIINQPQPGRAQKRPAGDHRTAVPDAHTTPASTKPPHNLVTVHGLITQNKGMLQF